MRGSYRLQGDLDHGWLVPNQPDAAWLEAEHLTVAHLSFPLVVRVRYQLTRKDKTWLSAFEELANARFLERLEAKEEGVVEKIHERQFRKVDEKELQDYVVMVAFEILLEDIEAVVAGFH